MLHLSKSDPRRTTSRPVAAGVGAIEEGIGLIAVREGGIMKVKPGVGAANTEEFAGFAINERTAPANFPLVRENQSVVLLETGIWGIRIPKAVVGTPRITYSATNVALTEYTADLDSVLEAGEYKLATLTNGDYSIQVVEADLGKKLNVIYSYAPTVADLMMLGGDNSPVTFSTITGIVGETGVFEEGVVYTSNYDVIVDWANWTPAAPIKIGANGVVKTSGNGATVPGGRVIEAPTADSPFLGISFRVA